MWIWNKQPKKKHIVKKEEIRISKCCNRQANYYYTTGWTCSYCYKYCDIKPPVVKTVKRKTR